MTDDDNYRQLKEAVDEVFDYAEKAQRFYRATLLTTAVFAVAVVAMIGLIVRFVVFS